MTFAIGHLDLTNFEEFLGEIFPQISTYENGWLKVGEDNFNIIRMFLIGSISEIGQRVIGLFVFYIFHKYTLHLFPRLSVK